jgi:hypothetical protein
MVFALEMFGDPVPRTGMPQITRYEAVSTRRTFPQFRFHTRTINFTMLGDLRFKCEQEELLQFYGMTVTSGHLTLYCFSAMRLR